jgi:hypothetical protein
MTLVPKRGCDGSLGEDHAISVLTLIGAGPQPLTEPALFTARSVGAVADDRMWSGATGEASGAESRQRQRATSERRRPRGCRSVGQCANVRICGGKGRYERVRGRTSASRSNPADV